ncbi:VirB4 family type IV secretion system protein [Paenibacillus hubeiensis]|uniref:VirB4 family type IV secretion system protein n=1 Tax=Paenibacillus hubeiensis TaxID=3077330 RepID=UPI0031BB4CDA
MSNAVAKKLRRKKSENQMQPKITGLLDIISPTAIEFQNKNIISGELHQRTLVIVDYPEKVTQAWISRMATMPGVVLSIHCEPTDPNELLREIKISMGELEAKIIAGGNPILIQRARSQLKGAHQLIKKIDTESQKVFFITVVMLVHANDPDTLNDRVKRVESALAATGMRGRTPMFRQEEGYKSVGPYGMLAPEIRQLGARNMPTETVAAMYPFVYSGINDGDGILLGSDKSGGIVLFDLWKREGSRTNSNITVLGRPGVGKSTVIKKILMYEWARGTKIIVLDPESEYKDLCHNLNGDWINCAGDPRGRINPLQARSVPMDDEDDKDPLFTEADKSRGELGLHFQFLRTFYRLNLRAATEKQLVLLEIALEEVYKQFGIDWSTKIETVPNDKWPHQVHLFEYCEQRGQTAGEQFQQEWAELALYLRSLAIGADQALWAGHTTLQPESNFICLDINGLLEADENILKAQTFNILSWAWNYISRDRTERVIFASDETYLIVDPEYPQPLKFIRNTSKRIRKYEGGLMVITHNMVDFMDPAVRRYGQALLDNPVYKIIMGQGENDIQALQKLMQLSEMEVETLLAGNRGEGLFVAGNRRIHASIEVAPFELEMFGRGGGR